VPRNEISEKTECKNYIIVHEEQKLHPPNLPEESRIIDYKDYLVQDLIFTNWNFMYRRRCWKIPSGAPQGARPTHPLIGYKPKAWPSEPG